MAYRLFGAIGSGAAMVELALAEAGVDYEFVKVALGKGAKDADAYLQINPTGKVPALQTPEGGILTESAAILLTLADRHPKAGLLPRRRGPARALVVQWTVFVVSEVYPMIEFVDYPERLVAPSAGRALRERGRERIRRRWVAVEAAIAGRPWLAGQGPTVADLAIAVVSRWSTGNRWRRANCPRIEAVAEALSSRPGTRSVWRKHFGS